MPTLDTLELSSQLLWIDETQWCGLAGAMAQTLDGLPAIQSTPAFGNASRPITLGGSNAWIAYSDVLILQDWSAVQGKQLTLVLEDGREFEVVFRIWDTPVVDAEQLVPDPSPSASDVYILNALKLMAVS